MTDAPHNIPVLDYARPSRRERPFGLYSVLLIAFNIASQIYWPASLSRSDNVEMRVRIVVWTVLATFGVLLARKARNSVGWNLFGFIVGFTLNLLMLAWGAIMMDMWFLHLL
jgi:hypothetical protein